MRLPESFMRLASTALDILYPPTCIGCQAPDAWFCQGCLSKLFLYHRHACPKCGERRKKDHACEGKLPFVSVTICGPYADPLWRRLLTRYKYHAAFCLETVLEEVLKKFRLELLEPWPWAGYERMMIVSLPTDTRHIHERGFDHAQHIANSVQRILVPWGEQESLLKRKKRTLAHANLPADMTREANIQGVFEVTKPIQGPVLLIDDVFTTGATANEAARALLNAGASQIHLFTLASGK